MSWRLDEVDRVDINGLRKEGNCFPSLGVRCQPMGRAGAAGAASQLAVP